MTHDAGFEHELSSLNPVAEIAERGGKEGGLAHGEGVDVPRGPSVQPMPASVE